MAPSILIVDDDPATVQAVKPILCQEGYHVACLPPGHSALHRVAEEQPNLVLLGLNGADADWRFCHQLLSCLQAPLFLLFASDREVDRARGLSMGAADCLSKNTLSLVELLARIRALLRRDLAAGPQSQQSLFVDGDLTVDLLHSEVWRAGQLVSLTPTEYRLLSFCLQHAGEELPYEWLLAQVWGPRHTRSLDSLCFHVHNLRQKLEPDPASPRRFITCRGRGYLFRRIAVD